jgi:hypothetical protein
VYIYLVILHLPPTNKLSSSFQKRLTQQSLISSYLATVLQRDWNSLAVWDSSRMDCTVLLTYGKEKDGYFNSPKFIIQFQKALQIGAIKRPNCKVVHLIDHSGCHDAKAKDALNVNKMTVHNNCKSQPMMRSTFFGPKRTPQEISKKGLVTVLLKRNKNPFLANLKPKPKKDLISMLLEEPDFVKSEKTNLIGEVLTSQNTQLKRHDTFLWGVKFHPELMFIAKVVP